MPYTLFKKLVPSGLLHLSASPPKSLLLLSVCAGVFWLAAFHAVSAQFLVFEKSQTESDLPRKSAEPWSMASGSELLELAGPVGSAPEWVPKVDSGQPGHI